MLSAQTFGKVVKGFEGDDLVSDIAHKLAAAGVGCITASAKKQDCSAGALGAALGETIAQLKDSEEDEFLIKLGIASPDQLQRSEDITVLTTGAIALLLNSAILNHGGTFIGSNTAYEQAQNEKTANALLMAADIVSVASGVGAVYQVTKGGRIFLISAKDYLAWKGKRATANEVLNRANQMAVDVNTGLKQAKIYSTNLNSQRALNLIDNGSLKPAEAAAGAQLEPILGKLARYTGTNSSKNPDFVIIEGAFKDKTIDVMYTTNKLDPKEIEGLNKFYAKNMSKGDEINNIKAHLAKADFVPVDFRVLDSTNQKIFLNFVKTLPKSQQNQFIIIR